MYMFSSPCKDDIGVVYALASSLEADSFELCLAWSASCCNLSRLRARASLLSPPLLDFW
jgi:hypothetical protein